MISTTASRISHPRTVALGHRTPNEARKNAPRLFAERSKPRFCSDPRGLSSVEYVIILVLMAAAAVGTWSTLGQTLRGKMKASIGEMRQVTIEQK